MWAYPEFDRLRSDSVCTCSLNAPNQVPSTGFPSYDVEQLWNSLEQNFGEPRENPLSVYETCPIRPTVAPLLLWLKKVGTREPTPGIAREITATVEC